MEGYGDDIYYGNQDSDSGTGWGGDSNNGGFDWNANFGTIIGGFTDFSKSLLQFGSSIYATNHGVPTQRDQWGNPIYSNYPQTQTPGMGISPVTIVVIVVFIIVLILAFLLIKSK